MDVIERAELLEQTKKKFYKIYCGNPDFYSLEEIHAKKDLDGNTPTLYRISSNRSGGKTTNVLLWSWFCYDEMREQFMIFVRNKYELDAINKRLGEVMRIMGKTENLYLSWTSSVFCSLVYGDDPESQKIIGYATSLKNPDALKNYSNEFVNVQRAIFDEFQLESGAYLKDEIKLLLSCLASITRGNGIQSREIVLYCLGNEVSEMNPLDIKLQVHKRRRPETRFLRGHGWIAEFGYIDNAAKQMQNNRLLNALDPDGNIYMNYAMGKERLINSTTFVDGSGVNGKYLATIIINGNRYGVLERNKIWYVTHKINPNFNRIISFTAADHNEGTRSAKTLPRFYKEMKWKYDTAQLRFDDIETKSDVLEILSINLYK